MSEEIEELHSEMKFGGQNVEELTVALLSRRTPLAPHELSEIEKECNRVMGAARRSRELLCAPTR